MAQINSDLVQQITAMVTAALMRENPPGANSLPQNPGPNRTSERSEEPKPNFSGGIVPGSDPDWSE